MYDVYRLHQARFRIPSIIVSSALGLLSFGQRNFENGHAINIGQNMSGSLLASSNLQKLKEIIDLELALPIEDRSHSGLIFVRDAYNRFEKCLDAAPSVLKRVRFVKPLSGVLIEKSDLGEAVSVEV